jgi:hypothetical protein
LKLVSFEINIENEALSWLALGTHMLCYGNLTRLKRSGRRPKLVLERINEAEYSFFGLT